MALQAPAPPLMPPPLLPLLLRTAWWSTTGTGEGCVAKLPESQISACRAGTQLAELGYKGLVRQLLGEHQSTAHAHSKQESLHKGRAGAMCGKWVVVTASQAPDCLVLAGTLPPRVCGRM